MAYATLPGFIRLLHGGRAPSPLASLSGKVRQELALPMKRYATVMSRFLLLGLVSFMLEAQSPAPVHCPASITVTETPAPAAGWRTTSGRGLRTFERVSIYNGKEGGPEFELAPTGQKENGKLTVQTWSLKAYRDMNLFLRCRYRDTAAFLSIDIPEGVETCTFTFEIAAGGRIAGKPAANCK
jgi:hypothetical protein